MVNILSLPKWPAAAADSMELVTPWWHEYIRWSWCSMEVTTSTFLSVIHILIHNLIYYTFIIQELWHIIKWYKMEINCCLPIPSLEIICLYSTPISVLYEYFLICLCHEFLFFNQDLGYALCSGDDLNQAIISSLTLIKAWFVLKTLCCNIICSPANSLFKSGK